jgi:hypothetical protein
MPVSGPSLTRTSPRVGASVLRISRRGRPHGGEQDEPVNEVIQAFDDAYGVALQRRGVTVDKAYGCDPQACGPGWKSPRP